MAMRKIATLLKGVALLLFFFASPTFGQSQTVSGTIIADDDGSPLLGVTVTNKSTNKKTTTNSSGFYTINASRGQQLSFSYVGYSTKELTVGDQKSYSVRLVLSDKDVNEVVVTAYGVQSGKRNLGYQTNTVSGEEIAQTRRENFINSLAGRIPGATITSTTGMPGASTSIILRGPTSIDGTNQPLFVVDGLIIDNSAFEMQDRLPAVSGRSIANNSNDYTNRAADLNPEDIESVTVIKGGEATALYGSEGANGVIIITTKKGKKGKASVAYNNSFRLEKVTRFPQIQTEFDQGFNGINDPADRRAFGQPFAKGTQFYDNISNFFRTGISQQHNLSVEGGADAFTYRFTGSYRDQQGIVPNTGLKVYNFRINTTFKLSPKFNIQTSAAYTNTNNLKASRGTGGFMLSLLSWPIDDDVRQYLNTDGSRRTIRGNLNRAEDDNPFFDVYKNLNRDINDRLFGNFQIGYDPTKWLNLTAIMGIDTYTNTGDWFTHPESNFGRLIGGSIVQFREKQRLINGVYRATARKKIGNINNTLIAAFTFDSRKYEVNSIKGERLFDPTLISINNSDPITQSSITTAENYNKIGAFVTYSANYKNWLNASVAGRMDGSSRLVDPLLWDSKDPFFFYWNASGNIILSDAVKLPRVIKFAKIRASFATTGRDPRAPYVKSNQYRAATTTGGGFTPFVIQGNRNLSAEFTKVFEAGTEIKFLDGRLNVDFTYYNNITTDQLLNARLAYASGAILKWFNGGTTRNRGIELQLTTNPIKSKKFNWDLIVNFARNRSKILEMPNGYSFFYNSDSRNIGAAVSGIQFKGSNLYMMSSNRYLRNTRGDILINPANGLPVVFTDLNTPTGNREPGFTGAFINTFTFLNDFSISFNLDFRRGGDVFNGTAFLLHTRGLSTRTVDRLTPRVIKGVLNDGLQNTANPTPNTIVITPFYRSDYYTTTGVVEEDFIERDINWLRLRDLTFSYRLPANLIKRQRIVKSASVFFTGTDLFLFTNYSGQDPASNSNNVSSRGGVSGTGFDLGNLAVPVGFNFGIKAQF